MSRPNSCLSCMCSLRHVWEMHRASHNRINTPCMTVYLVISQPKILYIHRVYMVLANPRKHFKCISFEVEGVHERRTSFRANATMLMQMQMLQRKCNCYTVNERRANAAMLM
jgi:hypothetical protein